MIIFKIMSIFNYKKMNRKYIKMYLSPKKFYIDPNNIQKLQNKKYHFWSKNN